MKLPMVFAALMMGACRCEDDPHGVRLGYDQASLNDIADVGSTDTGAHVSAADFSCEELCAYDGEEIRNCELVEPEGDEVVAVACERQSACIGGRLHEAITTVTRGRGPSRAAAALAQMAHDEWASVHAFQVLAEELRGHGAPNELVLRVLQAAEDEVRHGRAVAAQAQARGGEVPEVVTMTVARRSLEAVARENIIEAVVNETWLALVAHVQARDAEPSLRPLFAVIAADETRHAMLARDLDRWFRGQLDATACSRLDAARDEAVRTLLAGLDVASPELGRPHGSEALRLAAGLRDLYWS